MENVIVQVVLMKITEEKSHQQFVPLSDAEIHGLLHPAQGIFPFVASVSPAALNTE
jgi:hypothetical protein